MLYFSTLYKVKKSSFYFIEISNKKWYFGVLKFQHKKKPVELTTDFLAINQL